MYPLTTWSAQTVTTRLNNLLDEGYTIEALLAAAQTIEQLLKRCIKYQLNRSGKTFYIDKNDYLKKLVPSSNAKQVNPALQQLASLQKIKKAWNLYAKMGCWPSLPNVINTVLPGSWNILSMGNKPRSRSQKFYWKGEEQLLHKGIFTMRHQVVHGTYGPVETELNFLARVAVDLVEALLDSETGLEAHTKWNPQKRMPRFKKP
jgi:hypothetical protein